MPSINELFQDLPISVPSSAHAPPSPFQRHFISTSTGFAASSSKDKDTGKEVPLTEAETLEAYESLASAFSSLITTAYDLMAEGKPMEAEHLLLRGAEKAEELLGANSVQVAPLWDQLALFQFMHDRNEEAKRAAKKAYDAVKAFAQEEGSPQARGAAATAAIRYAAAIVGTGMHHTEAADEFKHALYDLDHVIQTLEEEIRSASTTSTTTTTTANSSTTNATTEGQESNVVNELSQYLDKFLIAQGEARFYSALCALADIANPTPEDVESFTEEMEGGLQTMTQHLGPRHPLTACALREHNRLTEGAVESERGPLAEALYGQEIRLHQSFDQDNEQAAALYYQLGTLQYCSGRHEQAIRSLNRCIELIEHEFEGGAEHLLTVKHRLGMALGAVGKHAHARDVFESVAPGLIEKIGEGNPVSKELDFMLALMKVRELRGEEEEEGGEVDATSRRQDEQVLLQEMEAAIKDLKMYGEEHMLVKYAVQLFNNL